MAKNIVICCDGTGNEFGEQNSNVVKLYKMTFKIEIFETFVRSEMRLPHAPANSIAQFGLDHSARLPGSGLELRFEDLIDLPFDAQRHSFPKL
jgi:hypothetical protein